MIHKLSIITVNFNNFKGLNKTINSVNFQNNSPFEFIIIDGNSIDGSLNAIQNFEKISKPHIDFHWISEPDTGVYNAMNKGIKIATGDYLLFLNSGDYLFDENTLKNFDESRLEEDIVVGGVLIKESDDTENYELKITPKNITAKYLFNGYIPHPSSFIKRNLFDKVGLYNENNKIVSDWEFFLKALLLHNATFNTLDFPVGVFITDGLSCKPENAKMIDKEKQNVLATYFPYFYPDYKDYVALEKQNTVFKESLDYKVVQWLKNVGIMYIVYQVNKVLKKVKKILYTKRSK